MDGKNDAPRHRHHIVFLLDGIECDPSCPDGRAWACGDGTMIRTRNNFTKATQRAAFTRSNGICECHLLASAGVPGFSVDGCGVRLGIGNTFYEHINPDALSKDNSLGNCAALSKTCWSLKTRTYDLPVIARTKRIEDDARGIKDPWRKRLPGGRDSPFKIKLNRRQVVIRATGERA